MSASRMMREFVHEEQADRGTSACERIHLVTLATVYKQLLSDVTPA